MKIKSISNTTTLLAALIISGCSYNGVVSGPIHQPPLAINPSPAQGITLVDNRDEIDTVKFKHGIATLSYDLKDSLFDVAKTALKSSFKKIDTSKSPLTSNPVYAIPHFKLEAGNGDDVTTGLISHAKIDFYDTSTKKLIDSVQESVQSGYSRPGSLNGLAFLTGFTLFAATPITLPAGIQIAGNAVGEIIKDNEKLLASSLSSQIIYKQKIAEAEAADEECHMRIVKDPRLEVIVGKVSLNGIKNQSFDMLANTQRPNAEEKEALRMWSVMQDNCKDTKQRLFDSTHAPRELIAIFDFHATSKNNLTLALYNGELTYGEFARKRREISNQLDADLARAQVEMENRAQDAQDRQRRFAIEQERIGIARAQANAAESMAFQSVLSNIQQANSNIIQQQTLNSINRLGNQSVYRSPTHTTCTPSLGGSINCTSN